MKKATPILITASVIVDAPLDVGAAEELTQRITEEMDSALTAAFEDTPSVHNISTFSFHWLEEEGTNAAICSKCGRWTTNREKPDPLDGLGEGVEVGGQLICDECRCFGD